MDLSKQTIRQELDALKRQGLRLTGRLAAVERSTKSILKSLDLSDQFWGSAIYVPDDKYTGELAVIHHTMGNVTDDHKRFGEDVLRRRRVMAAETSVGDALQSGKTGVYSSHMAKHDCLNIVVDEKHGPFVLQLAFDQGAKIDIKNPGAIVDQYVPRYGSIKQAVSKLREDFGKNMSENLQIDPPISPNAVVVSADISGYTKILEEHFPRVAFAHTKKFREEIEKGMRLFDGVFDREAGDGITIGFSDLGSDILGAAQKMISIYKDILKNEDPKSAIGKSKLKVAVAAGYFERTVEGAVFKPHVKHDSLAYNNISDMLKAAPRDRDAILFTPETLKILSGSKALKTIAHPTPSTFTREVHEWLPQ